MPIILQKAIVNRQTTTHPQKATAANRETTTHPQKAVSKVAASKSSMKVNTGPADVVKNAKTTKKVKK